MSLNVSGVSRCYQVGGMVIQVKADLPFSETTFLPSIETFRIHQDADVTAVIQHHFSLPAVSNVLLPPPIHRKVPWAVYDLGDAYLYLGITDDTHNHNLHHAARFTKNHQIGEIYNPYKDGFWRGMNSALTLFPTDQILIGRLIADRQGCIFHSAGMILNQQGFLFVGHSGAGKSTLTTLLRNSGEILCDDRNIARRHAGGWRVYGTWSHGDIPDVSPASAPLRAIVLIEQADENHLIRIDDRREIVRRLPFFIVKPLVTADWWEKTLDLAGQIAREVPVYRLRFAKSERVIDTLKPLID
jgi:hypothetical protein